MTQNPQDPNSPEGQPADQPEGGSTPQPEQPSQPEQPTQPEQPAEPPSYGAPAQPDPAQQPPSYGAPTQPDPAQQPPSYGAPQSPQPGYGSVPPPPPPSYGAPEQPGHGSPQPGYGTPPPQQPSYGAPQQGFPSAPPPPPPSYGQYGAAQYGGPGGTPWGGAQPFSVGNAISYGWNGFKSKAGPWIGAFLIVVVLGALVNGLLNPTVRTSYDVGDMSGSAAGGFGMVEYTFGGQLLAGVAGIITMMLGAVLIQGAVHQVNGRFDGFGAFTRFDHAGPLFLSALLLGAVNLVLGLLSVVSPFLQGVLALVWGVVSVFVLYIAADRGVQPVQAVQESVKLVTANLGSVIVMWLATIGLVIAGIIVICFTGLIVVVPLLTLAWAFAYKTLSGQQVAPA